GPPPTLSTASGGARNCPVLARTCTLASTGRSAPATGPTIVPRTVATSRLLPRRAPPSEGSALEGPRDHASGAPGYLLGPGGDRQRRLDPQLPTLEEGLQVRQVEVLQDAGHGQGGGDRLGVEEAGVHHLAPGRQAGGEVHAAGARIEGGREVAPQ